MPLLTQEQTRELHSRYTNVVNFIDNENREQPKGLTIKKIQLPFSMTQSIAYHYIIENPSSIEIVDNIFPENIKEGNNRTYDLIYETDLITINIEVKATGKEGFQRFRPKALSANFVFWLNFNDCNYDIAIFKPQILDTTNKSEITINWRDLIKLENIKLIQNRTI